MAGAARERRSRARPRREGAPGAPGLLALLLAGAVLGLALWELQGGPRAPDGARIREVLAGSELSEADAAAAAASAGWIVLSYLALSVALRLLLLVAARISGGARWARAGLRVSTLVTIPAVRRLVDSGVGGALLAASWLPMAPHVEDASKVPPAITAPVETGERRPGAAPAAEARRFALYTVAPGDDLWEIARRLYSDGSRVVEIVEANRGREVGGGERFSDPRIIRAGWVLRVPLPERNVATEDGVLTYRVRRGDHLWGIAERFLGDGFRWIEIWERNRDREVAAGTRFTDPDRLRPGWVLEVPLREGVASPGEAPAPLPADAAGSPDGATSDLAGAGGARTAAAAGGGRDWDWARVPRTVAWSAAGFAVLGGAAVFVERLRRAGSLRLGRGAGGRDGPGDAARVALAAGELERALVDVGFPSSMPLLALERGARIDFTVTCPPGDAGALLAARHDLERRLGSGLEVTAEGHARLVFALPGSGRLPDPIAGAPDEPPPLVVPVGANDAGVLYLNLAVAGGVALSGEGPELRALLRSWLETLRTTCPPGRLSIRADSGAARMLRADAGLLYFGGAPDGAGLAEELEEMIESRASDAGVDRPVVALFDLAPGDVDLPATAMHRGPAVGVHAICCLPPGASAESLPSAGASIALGPPDADAPADVASPGAITLRIGREAPLVLEPVQVRREPAVRWSEGADPDPPGAPPADGDVSPARRIGGSTPGTVVATSPDGRGEKALHPGVITPCGIPVGVAAGRGGGQGATAYPPRRPEPPHEDVGPAPDGPVPRGEIAPDEDQAEPADGDDVAAERDGGGDAPDGGEPEPSREAERSGLPEPGGAPARPPPALRQPALLTPVDLSPGADTGPPGAGPPFSVRCLGPLEVVCGAAAVDGWPIAKSRELLAFLAVHGGRPVACESAAGALWPDLPWDASLRHTIANAVSGLRGVLRSAAGDDDLNPVVTFRQRYELQTALFRIDLDEFESAVRRASVLAGAEALREYERAAALSRGDFLEGETFPWLDAYRADYRRRVVEAASRAAGIADGLGEAERAAALHRVVIERDPTDEAAARGLMRHLAAARDVTGIRKVVKVLTEALQEELDDPRAGPGPETRALLADLLDGERGAAR